MEDNETTTQQQEILENNQKDSEPEDAPDANADGASSEDDERSKALAQVEEFKLALQRERADFQNFRKRVEREHQQLRAKTIGETLAKLLPVLDDFERALHAIPEAEKDNDWMAGIFLIQRKLNSLLDGEGIAVIDPLGDEFDPNLHEAIGADDANDEYKSGQVTAVLQKGYAKGDVVLRPAMVRVAN